MAREHALGPLYQEHLYLGASFRERTGSPLAMPEGYAGEGAAFPDGAALSDLWGQRMRLMHGGPARDFCEAAFAGRKLAVGEARFQACLMGDGRLASVALAARTGDSEYLAIDPTPRGELLCAWLDFLQHVNQNGYEPYKGLEAEDVSQRLVPLLLWGSAARMVLSDYVQRKEDLPAPGHVRDCALDGIACLVLHVPDAGGDCYLVLAPPQRAVALWRSFLSFEVVSPVGYGRLSTHAKLMFPWLGEVSAPGRAAFTDQELRGWGLARTEGDFVGARALRA